MRQESGFLWGSFLLVLWLFLLSPDICSGVGSDFHLYGADSSIVDDLDEDWDDEDWDGEDWDEEFDELYDELLDMDEELIDLDDDVDEENSAEEDTRIKEMNYYKDLIQSKGKDTSSFFKDIIESGSYLFNDMVMEPLIIPFFRLSGEYQDIVNHHIIDPVRRGKHFARYMDSVMLGTFDNMQKEDTGTESWPYALVGLPYGFVVKNVIADFKLGSEVKSPGVIDSKYHNHPALVQRLGAETREVASKMSETHKNELVIIDVVKPFMPRLELWDEENSLFSSLYNFYYATRTLVTDVYSVMEFEDTDYFKRTGRYEESDRTFLFHWNKTISKRSSFRSGQIIRVDRKGYFSMGPVPIAWNYCEVLLHEGGAKDIEVIKEDEETEIYFEHPETYVWGIRGDTLVARERTRTVRKKVVKQVPNVTVFRVYTENLCQAAEASVRSKSEVITFTTRRAFSWLVPGLAFIGAPSVSYLLMRQLSISNYFPLTASLMAGVFLVSWVFPSMWVPEIADTMHSIKFPPPDEF